jgi:outer membrane protein TolC
MMAMQGGLALANRSSKGRSESMKTTLSMVMVGAAVAGFSTGGDARAQPPAPTPAAPTPAAASALPSSTAPLSLVDAVRTTLRQHPAILTAIAQLRQRHAELNVARGPFDPVITAGGSYLRNDAPVLPGAATAPGERDLLTNTAALSLGASAATVWGTSITPSVSLSRVHTTSNIEPLVGTRTDPGQFAQVNLGVVQHLLRGAGTVGAASAVAAAKLAREAAVHNVDGIAQAQVYLALVAYFQLVAAAQDLTLLRDAETAARKVVEDTRALVEGQQRPRSDLPSLEGNLANRSRAVLEAEDDRLQALFALELAMGLGLDGASDFQLGDGFPDPSMPTPDRDTILRLAHRDRGDLLAAHATVASTGESLRGAEHNTLPSLDLNLSIGYAGALEKDGVGPFFAALAGNVPGVNGGVGLSLALPVSNTAQEADRDVKRSTYDEASIAERDLERQLPLAVVGALEDLRLSRSALAASSEAVKQFGQALSDQHDKLHEGVGTVIDAVLTEQLLISAELSRTANQLRYAAALAKVFFEMGALPANENAASVVVALFGGGGSHGGQ